MEAVLKVRPTLFLFLLIACIALGTASASGGGSGLNYLALGDSVAFSYISQAGYEYFYPTNFVGYADHLSSTFNLNTVNAACPGETTSSFISSTGPDNGCRAYRSQFPLHVDYASTQLAFAMAFLRQNRGTRLVTIQLGANDGFLLEKQCNYDPTCIENGAPQLFATVAANMQIILTGLRSTGYQGPIIIVNYYSVDYTDQRFTELTAGVNQAITSSAPIYGAEVADVFSAFQPAASTQFAQGHTCAAGLLNNSNPATSPPTCDVHPSQSGHKLISQVIAGVFRSLPTKD
jgi:lysophospholipase L1-like esterase